MVQLVGSSSLGLGKLIDGKNQFVHIRYSANADGSNMTAEIQANTKYIGIMTSSSETPPTNPSDYSWGRFVGTSGTSSYTWIRYSPNEDGSSMTTTANEETKYIGVAITSENSAPTDYTRYSWALFKGNDGRGVEKTEVSYQKSTSGLIIPTGSWETTIPSLDDGEYLWTRTLFTYTDDTTTSTFSVSRNGTAGLGISGTDVHYQKSTSGTIAPTGTWTATIPNVGPNEYLWTRTTMSYTDGSTRVSYSVGKMGADGRDAQLLYLTASSQIQAFDKDNQPKTTQAITISAKLQNASGTATFTAIPYIGNTAQTPITLGGTGNDRTLSPSQWTDSQWTIIAITATLGSLTDTISINKVKDGDTGPRGSDGIAGKDGVGIANTSIAYAQSTSGTIAPATGWDAQVPTLIKGQYLWTKTTWTYTDESTETGFTVSYNAKDGNNGADGIAGKDGVGIASTLIQYAGSTSGTAHPTSGWSSQIPSVPGGQYLWTKTTWTYTDNTSETGYSVAKMGDKGDQGIQGPKGADGQSLYTWLKYADDANGNGMSETPDGKKYIGLAYNKTISTESSNPSDYTWSLIQGATGVKGADGITHYTWIKYADTATGSGLSDSPTGKLYIGLAYNKTTPTESTNPSDYQWALIKGDKGDKGDKGATYKALTTNYQYNQEGINQYSANGYTGAWVVNEDISDLRNSDMVTLSVKNTSKNAFSLIVARVNSVGKDSGGRNIVNTTSTGLLEIGATGNGISSITTEFYLSTSKTAQSNGSWGTTQPTWESGKYLWTRNKITYTNGSTAYTTPQCSSEWEAVNEIQIGGRNLLFKTGFFDGDQLSGVVGGGNKINLSKTIITDANSPSGKAYRINKYKKGTENVYGGCYWSMPKKLVAGKKYTWSVYVRGVGTVDAFGPEQGGHKSVKLTDTWTKVSHKFTANSNQYFQFVFYSNTEFDLYFTDLMLEEGNAPTPWSPAPEDTQDQIDQANINISNKVDQGAYENDQATIWGSINDKMDDAEFRAYKAVMDNLKSSYEAFVGEGGRFEQELQNATAREQAIIQELGAKVNQLNFINTYIRESEEGIVIGAKNNPMQMLLSKDSLSFMDGGQTVAYFSNQSFYINRGAVVESLQVGVHKLTKIDNYHTVIQYIPN